MDKFTSYCNRVKKALKSYETIREQRETATEGLKKTIERESIPFIKGHFTLAVIGKMSSGKSTFINALLGNRSLLPTAYEQTTCTLTEIEYGDSLQIQVRYGNGCIKTFIDSNELLSTAAIPVKYQQLPINLINKLILKGKSEQEIINQKDLLDKVQGAEVNIDLLKEYIQNHSSSNIPTRVLIKYPLPKCYRGWKIIDTPGVSALGGIEDETREFLNGKNEFGYNNVDAIIFVNSARNQIEDSAFKKFVDQTFLNISPETKKRIFMVITSAADEQFMLNQVGYMETARRIFVKGMKIKPERLICIDSLCHLFSLYACTCGKQITSFKIKDVPSDWDPKLWNLCLKIRNNLEYDLRENDREINNETLIEELKRISGFHNLHYQLDKFITDEKSSAFNRIMDNINKDITFILNDINKKKEILEKSIGNETLDELNKKVTDVKTLLENSKLKFNEMLITIRDKYSKKEIWSKFDNFKLKMNDIRQLSSIEEIQKKAEEILFDVENEKNEILKELTSLLGELWESDCKSKLTTITLPPIDFSSMEEKAKNNHTYQTGGELIGYKTKRNEQEGFWGKFKRFLHLGGYTYEKIPQYSESKSEIDYEKAASEFANKIYSDFTNKISVYIDDIINAIKIIGDEAKKEVDREIERQQYSYEKLAEKNKTTEEICNSINNLKIKREKIQKMHCEIKQICYA